jgi:ABC-type oligopeptide transport system substrate-binding subunit
MMKTAATLFLLVVVATTVLAAASEHGGAGAALPSFFVYECPRPLNWDVVHDISSRFILSDCSGTLLQFINANKCKINPSFFH